MTPLETPRLIIRMMQIDDAPFFDAYKNHVEFCRYKTVEPDPEYNFEKSIAKKLERMAEMPRTYWALSVLLKETKQVIGDIRVFSDDGKPTICEMAFGLNPDYWGNGLMPDAVACVVAFCHDDLEMHRVVIRADAENVASCRVAEKIGMIYEGSSRYDFQTWRGYLPELKIYASVRPDLLK